MDLFATIAERISSWLDAAVFGLSPTAQMMLLLGLCGQLLFVSRWFVQWIASERARDAIVPELFWYLSFVGGSLVLVYGFYSANLVLILGQFGVFIYARNIYLIWRKKKTLPAPTEAPGE
ncbi:MAG: lipid-A-disaccharide synthase N-terminal domain-containing protein [Pseudomonadota bacterium]